MQVGSKGGQPRAERFGAKVTQKHILSSKASEPFFFFFIIIVVPY